MPRIFRARPAPPVGRSINIGVTMRPVAPRPVAQAVVENGVAPAVIRLVFISSAVISEGDISGTSIVYSVYGLDDESVPVSWFWEDAGGENEASLAYQFDAGLGVTFIFASVGAAKVRIFAEIEGETYYGDTLDIPI